MGETFVGMVALLAVVGAVVGLHTRKELRRAAHLEVIKRLHAVSAQQQRKHRITARTEHDQEAA